MLQLARWHSAVALFPFASLLLARPAAAQELPPPPCVVVQTGELLSSNGPENLISWLALAGDRAVLSEGSGKVHIYERSSQPGWSPLWKEVATKNSQGGGGALAIRGDTLVIGAPNVFTNIEFKAIEDAAYDLATKTLYLATSEELLVLEPFVSSPPLPIQVPLALGAVRALTFEPASGQLLAVDLATDLLYRVDPLTGVETAIGPVGYSSVQGLALDFHNGGLFGVDLATDELILIDPDTGSGSSVGPVGYDLVASLACNPSTGALYGIDDATNQLLEIDRSSGAATVKGSVGQHTLRSLVWGGQDLGSDWFMSVDRNTDALYAVFENAALEYLDTVSYQILEHGRVYVHERDAGGPGAWGQALVIEPTPLVSEAELGAAVVFDGDDTVLVGEPGALVNGIARGVVHVLERDMNGQGAWGSTATLVSAAGTPYADFGAALALDGDRLLVAATSFTAADVVHVFERAGPGQPWSEVQQLSGSANFGPAIALEGDVAAIENGQRVDVFRRQPGPGGLFVLEAMLQSLQGGQTGWGDSLALVGGHLAVGEWLVPSAGSVHLYRHDGLGWELVSRFGALDGGSADHFGKVLATDGAQLLVGAWAHQHPGIQKQGAAYVYALADALAGQPVSYCTAGISAGGCTAILCAGGTASASAEQGFAVSAEGMQGQVDGLFFFGVNGRQASPWGTGTSFQCVLPPVQRTDLIQGTGTTWTCDGRIFRDLNALWCPNCPKPAKNPGAGAVVQAQLWYRDPLSTSNQTTSLSDAIEFSVGP